MPFKTKRHKIRAENRRYTLLDSGTFNYYDVTQEVKKGEKVSENINQRKIETNYNYVRRDLLKIMLITSLVVVIQIILKISI